MELAVGASEATIKSLLSKLGSLLAEEYALIRGVRGDIQFINDELASMQAFLSNLSSSGTDGHDDQTEDWMKQIRDVSYDIEDCVDDFSHGLRPDPRGNGLWSIIRRTLYEIQTWYPRRNIAAQIAHLKERAQHIGERRGRYGVRDPTPGKKKSYLDGYVAAEHQETVRQLIGIKKPVGVKDMHDLQEWIISDEPKLGVLSISGFGGVGKTTAAMALYRNCGVKFKRRAMVTVSHNTDPDVVLRDILRQVKPQVNGTSSILEEKKKTTLVPPWMRSKLSQIRMWFRTQDEEGSASNKEHAVLKSELWEHLSVNRYLLLIDDVWSASTWQTILKCLPTDNIKTKSRIIVTTRFQAVARASQVDHYKFHTMDSLSPKDAKDLFDESLSESRSTQGNQASRDQVPRRIWEMCGGLPLPIITMAGLVASHKETKQDEWSKVCETLFPQQQVCQKPEEFMRIINYCYNVLPSDLKTCSLYLCIFPKGRKVSRKRLIRRWIAEGFVGEKQGLSVEDVAETCFNQLIERKILRPVEYSSSGKVKSCQVHDMILEYIISKAGEENFATVVGGQWSMPTRSNKVRRMSLHNSGAKHAKKADRMNLSHVRSLTVFGSLDQLRLKSFKTGIVQVLDLEGCRGFKANHISISDICEMTLLKYLSLRGTDISKLPMDIGNLKYLETLDLRQTGVEELPKTVVLLERIGSILGGDKRTRKALKLPKEMKKGAMKTLRILSGIEIEGSTAVSNLHDLTGLRKLAIYKLHKSGQMFDDLVSSIEYLGGYSLQTLVIDDDTSDFHHKLGTMSTPPLYLSALELSGKLLDLPGWIPELKDIVKLTLSATALRPENLETLSQLKTLFSLTFSICATKHDPDIADILEKNKSDYGGEIFIPAGGFGKLKLLRVFIPLLPSLNFSEGAMLALERLELRFKRLGGLHGIDELKSLHDVILTGDGKADNTTKLILHDLEAAQKTTDGKYVLVVNE